VHHTSPWAELAPDAFEAGVASEGLLRFYSIADEGDRLTKFCGEKTLIKLKIVTQRRPSERVQVFNTSTGEDLGSMLGIQKVWYNAGNGVPFLSFDLSPDIEIEQIELGNAVGS
jgi:hypothetical protein